MTYHIFCKGILFLKNGLYCLMYYIYLVYIIYRKLLFSLCYEDYKTEFHRNMCILIRKIFVMAYLSVQNILFSNQRLK